MKTKSKRFLNLATLCLALLGTTLLTTQPAEAEVILLPINGRGSNPQVKSQAEENAENITYKEYMAQFGLGELEEPYYKDRFRGYLDGYKEGLKGSRSTSPEPKDIPLPDGFKGDRVGYTDGYEEGFGKGAHKHRPLEAEDASQDTENHTGEPSSREGATHDEKNHTDESPDGEDATDDKEIGDIIFDIITEVINWFYSLF
ncbi:hypothetical protein [Streptococcus pyogenes]|uniref:hypothetical protein n=1 Tax=Streptococcus pyogenes TaxID=1314 RepID=UPI00109C93FC|nr:hypothetical protein [Streptococcus pyogenes]VGU94383.1 Uncharacterised protein [Streptococcus pyogenes]